METAKKHLKDRTLSGIYLLTGNEPYLIDSTKRLFKKSLCGDNPMLCQHFYELPATKELIQLCQSVPFLSDYRLIIMDGCQPKDDEFINFIKDIPSSTVIVIKDKVDKRSKLYKAIKKYGVVCVCDAYPQYQLEKWIEAVVKKKGCTITPDGIKSLIACAGTDMNNLVTELQKLSMYGTITKEVVEKACFKMPENKVFDMITCAINGQKEQAMKLYRDLLSVNESPFKILALINRQLRILYLVQSGKTKSDNELASLCGAAPFVIKKSRKEIRYSIENLLRLWNLGVQLDEDIKHGKIKDCWAVEILLCEIAA